jgi:hypothetical protein
MNCIIHYLDRETDWDESIASLVRLREPDVNSAYRNIIKGREISVAISHCSDSILIQSIFRGDKGE